MGQGSIVVFNDFAHQIGQGRYDFRTGSGIDLEVMLITNAVVPVKTDVAPESADYTECSGGTYAAQPLVNYDFTLSVTKGIFVADSVTFAQDAGAGPQDCYYAVGYDDDAPEPCMWFWDLTEDGGVTPLSLRDAPIVLNFGSGSRQIFTTNIPANV